MYVIWSFEHRGWWGPGHCGYVSSLAQAGRYSAEQAIEIVRNGNMDGGLNETAVPVDEASDTSYPANLRNPGGFIS